MNAPLTQEQKRIKIAEHLGLAVLRKVEGRIFTDDHVKVRNIPWDTPSPEDFWRFIKDESLAGNESARRMLDGYSDHHLQHVANGWVHTQHQNRLGIWSRGGCSQAFPPHLKPKEDDRGIVLEVFCARDVPDYFNDLNAMHEAEKTLAQEQLWDIAALLSKRILKAERAGVFFIESAANILQAGAPEQAEAFGLALNLWTAD